MISNQGVPCGQTMGVLKRVYSGAAQGVTRRTKGAGRKQETWAWEITLQENHLVEECAYNSSGDLGSNSHMIIRGAKGRDSPSSVKVKRRKNLSHNSGD